jgi:hypothetical protein
VPFLVLPQQCSNDAFLEPATLPVACARLELKELPSAETAPVPDKAIHFLQDFPGSEASKRTPAHALGRIDSGRGMSLVKYMQKEPSRAFIWKNEPRSTLLLKPTARVVPASSVLLLLLYPPVMPKQPLGQVPPASMQIS